jgi:hypothetical protein
VNVRLLFAAIKAVEYQGVMTNLVTLLSKWDFFFLSFSSIGRSIFPPFLKRLAVAGGVGNNSIVFVEDFDSSITS